MSPPDPSGAGQGRLRPVARAALGTARLYSSAGAGYIAANSISHSATLARPLTHFAQFPTERQFGFGCLVVSVCSTLLLRGVATAETDPP